ncbi:hypothetical protein [Sediminibacillus massiliensis]|uniref:hypothetical protein n=1 Tax=Sediminibacillus massiliensis TaxID=1926277 RepID=UPI0009882E56|nr:hypothetical protein [Sediminibacillus massiliensis]
MQKRWMLLLIATLTITIAGCAGNTPGPQGQGEPQDGEFETTEEGYLQIGNENRRIIDRNGERNVNDQGEEHKAIRQTAESAADIRVEDIRFDGSRARVGILVQEQINSEERMALINRVRTALQREFPEYNFQVAIQ